MLMYYINCYTFLEQPEKDWNLMIQQANESPLEPSLFDWRGAYFLEKIRNACLEALRISIYAQLKFSGQQ